MGKVLYTLNKKQQANVASFSKDIQAGKFGRKKTILNDAVREYPFAEVERAMAVVLDEVVKQKLD